jgi:hypothetical protein
MFVNAPMRVIQTLTLTYTYGLDYSLYLGRGSGGVKRFGGFRQVQQRSTVWNCWSA